MAALARQASSTQLANVLGTIAPGLAPVPSGTGEEMFDCEICYMSKPVSAQFEPLDSCDHGSTLVCKECFTGHLKYEIDNGKVKTGVACCVDGCPSVLEEAELRPLVSAETLAKYIRFRSMAEDGTIRECGKCGHEQSGDPDNPIMTCGKCGSQYCYYHATSHEPTDEACRKFHIEQRSVEKQNLALLNRTAAACPRCKAVTTKSMGCNHMTCRCKAEWCWLCGMDITGNHQWHYTPGNPIGCPAMMMTDGEPNSRREVVLAAIREQGTPIGRAKNFWRGLLTLLRLPFEIVGIVLAAAIMITMAVVVFPCACCACFLVRNQEMLQPLIMYFAVLFGLPCLLPFILIRIVLVRLVNAAFLICCCSSPPTPRADMPEGLGPSPGAPKFGDLGGTGIEREHRHFDGAAAPKEGASASASAARPTSASPAHYGSTGQEAV